MPFKVFHFISNSKVTHNDFPFFSRFILCLAHCSFIYCICHDEPSSLFVYLFLITSRFVMDELELPSGLFETGCESTGKKRVNNYFNLRWIEVIKSALEDKVQQFTTPPLDLYPSDIVYSIWNGKGTTIYTCHSKICIYVFHCIFHVVMRFIFS